VAALHGAQQLDGALLVDQRGGGFALGDGGQEAGLDVGGFVHAGGDAVGDQVEEKGLFACRRVLQQLDQACGLFGVQRLGHHAQGGTLSYVFAVGFKHSYYLIMVPWPGRLIPGVPSLRSTALWAASPGAAGFPLKKLFSKFYAKGDGRWGRDPGCLVPLGWAVLVTL